jgi:hypothetical protein
VSRTKKNMIYLVVVTVVLLPVVWLAFLSATAKRPGNLGVADGRLAPCPATPKASTATPWREAL